jgi:hypothetical protein
MTSAGPGLFQCEDFLQFQVGTLQIAIALQELPIII